MWKGGTHEGEDPKYHNHGQGDAQNEALYGLFHDGFLFQCCNYGNDGQNENHWVVIKELACQLCSEGAEVDAVAAYAFAMEMETDEAVLYVPIKDGNATNN